MSKYTATHLGQTFTRKSDRTYTHTVLSIHSRREVRAAFAARLVDTWNSHLDYYQRRASGESLGRYRYTPEQAAEAMAAAKEWVAQGQEGFTAAALARFDAQAREPLQPDGDTYFVNVGWCGRLDLARKLAAKYPRTVILEATVL